MVSPHWPLLVHRLPLDGVKLSRPQWACRTQQASQALVTCWVLQTADESCKAQRLQWGCTLSCILYGRKGHWAAQEEGRARPHVLQEQGTAENYGCCNYKVGYLLRWSQVPQVGFRVLSEHVGLPSSLAFHTWKQVRVHLLRSEAPEQQERNEEGMRLYKGRGGRAFQRLRAWGSAGGGEGRASSCIPRPRLHPWGPCKHLEV